MLKPYDASGYWIGPCKRFVGQHLSGQIGFSGTWFVGGYSTAGQEERLELDRQQQTSSKLGKEYIKAVYCHPAYLTYMQSI